MNLNIVPGPQEVFLQCLQRWRWGWRCSLEEGSPSDSHSLETKNEGWTYYKTKWGTRYACSTSKVKVWGLHQARKKGKGQISRKIQFTISISHSVNISPSFAKCKVPCTAKELVLSEKAEQRGYIVKSLLEIPVQWCGAMLVGQETERGLAAFCCSSDSLTGIESATRFWELKMLWESRLERLVLFGPPQVNQVSLRAKIWDRPGFRGLRLAPHMAKRGSYLLPQGASQPKAILVELPETPSPEPGSYGDIYSVSWSMHMYQEFTIFQPLV